MESIKPRKQRKILFNAPLHKKRKWIASHLEENLMLKYDRRSIPVIKGDTVKIMRGSFKGHENKVVRVDVGKRYIEIEGITLTKADGNKIAKPVQPSNVLITKLNLTDKWRRDRLEKDLSEDIKKEIEKEAKEQVKEVEEEKKKQEELILNQEAEEADDVEEIEEIEEKKTEKPASEKTESEKPEKVKESAVKKEKTVKKTVEKIEKTKEKAKTTSEKDKKKKDTDKKTPVKTAKRKEKEAKK